MTRLTTDPDTQRLLPGGESFWAQLFQAVREAMLVFDDEQRIVALNAAAQELFACEAVQAIGRPLSALIPAGLPLDCGTSDHKPGGSIHVTGLTAAGGQLQLEGSVSSVDLDGSSLFLAILRPGSARLAQEGLSHFLASLVNSTEDAIIGATQAGLILSWNPGAERLYGYTAREALGKPVSIIIPPDRSDEVALIQDKMQANEPVQNFETVRMAKNGRRIDVAVTISAVRDEAGNVTGSASITHDITEEKRANARLLASEHRYRSLFENTPVAIWEQDFSALKAHIDHLRTRVDDLDTYLRTHQYEVIYCASLIKVIDVNRAALGLHGAATKTELIQNMEQIFTRESYLAFLHELMALGRGEHVTGLHTRMRTMNGTRLDVSVSWATAPGYEQTLSRVLLSAADITQRVQAQEALQRSLQQVQRSQVLLLALDELLQKVQRAHTAADTYRVIGEGMSRLGYRTTILALRDRGTRWGIVHTTVATDTMRLLEDLTGLEIATFSMQLPEDGLLRQVLSTGEARLFTGSPDQLLLEVKKLLPDVMAPLADTIARIVDIGSFACARLTIHDEPHGLLLVDGPNLTEADMTPITAFAAQASVALENARLYETAQQELAERRQAEAALRAAEARYRTLVEQLPMVVYTNPANDASYTSYVSPQIESILGYTAGEWADDPRLWEKLLHPEDREAILAEIRRGMPLGKSLDLEYRVLARDGHVVWLQDHSTLAYDADGQPLFWQGMMIDITERRLAEQAVAESEGRFHGLFEEAPVSFWEEDFSLVKQRLDRLRSEGVTDFAAYFRAHPEVVPQCAADVRIIEVNRATLDLFKAKDRNQMGASLSALFGPEQYASFQHELVHIAEGKTSFHWEGVNKTLDGDEVYVHMSWSVLPGYEDTLSRVVVTLLDITERRQAEQQIKRRLAELEAINRTSVSLRTAQNLDELLPCLTSVALEILDCQGGGIWFYEPAAAEPRLAYQQGWELIDIPTLHAGGGIPAHVIETGQPYISPDLQNDPLMDPSLRPGMAALCVPIRAGEEAGGALVISKEAPGLFGEDDVRLLTTLAEIAGNAIQRMRSYEQARRRADEFTVLYETARALAGQIDLAAVLQIILDQASSVFGAYDVTITLYDPAREELELVAAKGFPLPIGNRQKIGEGMSGRVAQTRQPLFLEDYHSWEHRLPGFEDHPVAAALEVPMIYHGELVGTIGVGKADPARRFDDSDLRLLSLFAAQAASAIQNARLFEETERRLQHISALYDVDMAISNSLDLRIILDMLLAQVTNHLHIDAAAILLLNPHTQLLEYGAGRGFRSNTAAHSSIRLGRGLGGRAALEQHILRIPNLADIREELIRPELVTREGFVAYFGVPLLIKGQAKGVLEIFHRAPLSVDEEWLKFLETLAGQAAIAIDNAALFNSVQRANDELALAYEATIEGWSHALDLRDKETEGHTRRVTDISLQLAQELGLPDEKLRTMRWGALLHDIGKMGIPDQILLKPGPLTDEEWDMMRRHPQFAFDMLSPIRYLQSALEIPYCHHEKWDGTGYPRGLQGERIPLEARIFAAVDVWDALTSDRPYRAAWSQEDALHHIVQQAGQQFDPRVVEAFLRLAGREGWIETARGTADGANRG